MKFHRKITGTYLGTLLIFSFLMCISFKSYGDNKIDITQSGASLTFNVEQIGANNEIKMFSGSSYFTGASWDVHFHQQNVGSQNTININEISGSNNTLRHGQGASLTDKTDTSFTYDGVGNGGHTARYEIYGNNNDVVGYQESDGSGSHTYHLHMAGSGNDIWTSQKDDSNKTINLTVYNSDNTASIDQLGDASHSANVTLDGTYGTNFSLTQQGTTAQSYTISQLCQNAAGCSISVTQQ